MIWSVSMLSLQTKTGLVMVLGILVSVMGER
jgi:hypothetical protein